MPLGSCVARLTADCAGAGLSATGSGQAGLDLRQEPGGGVIVDSRSRKLHVGLRHQPLLLHADRATAEHDNSYEANEQSEPDSDLKIFCHHSLRCAVLLKGIARYSFREAPLFKLASSSKLRPAVPAVRHA